MCESLFPVNIRVAVQEVIMVMVPVFFCQIITELAVSDGFSFLAQVLLVMLLEK